MLGLPRQAIESPEHSEDDRQLSIAELQGDSLHYVMAHLDVKMLGLPRQAIESPEHSEYDRQLSIAELQGDPLHYVMAHLDTMSLCSAVQEVTTTSGKTLHRASGPKAPCVSPLIIRLTRLAFDARGESDLRPAASSHIALVRDQAQHEYNPEGQMQPDSSDLVAGLPLRGTSLYVDTPGHFQSLADLWAGSHPKLLVSTVAASVKGAFDISLEPSGILSPNAGCSFDTSLVFCYANSVVQAPNEDLEGDYRCVELFKVPAGSLFRDALLENCTTFQLPQEPEERLQAETRTNSRFLWHSVPSTLHERSGWWGPLTP